MTDKELLELAAEAVRYKICSYQNEKVNCYGLDGKHNFHWNPLTDDGDALRLAIELSLTIIQDTDDKVCAVHWNDINGAHVAWKDSKYAATRRAIVRAAAEIGKSMS